MLFPGFERKRISTPGTEIALVTGGRGPPLLLLHGYPQTHVMWHRVAERLADRFTLVIPDLRGYGDSGKPASDANHESYSKRETGRDQIAVMRALGHERFFLAGHDRGARVAHRMTLDHPDRVQRLAVLDIIPTATLFATIDQVAAMAYYHWFFLAQPYDFPERLIGGDPIYYLHRKLGGFGSKLGIFAPEALAEYERCFRDPAVIHGSCEDYRAGASIDLAHDRHDAERRVSCPLLAIWSAHNLTGKHYDVLACWRERATDVRGQPLDCGHFMAEELPDETAALLGGFFAEG